jgi:hypothetical protein
MNVWVMLTLIAASALPGTGGPPAPECKDLVRLKGEWWLASTADDKREYDGDRKLRMTVGKDGLVVLLVGDVVTNQGVFVPVASAGKEKGIDLKLANGLVYRGVYRLGEDGVEFCFAAAGQPRPACLSPKAKEWREHWQRVDY